MIFEGIRAGQRYKKPCNISREGTAAPSSQPGTLRLLEMESYCFYSRKRYKGGKPCSLFCRIFFVAVLGKAGIAVASSAFTELFTVRSPVRITEGAALCSASPRCVPDGRGSV